MDAHQALVELCGALAADAAVSQETKTAAVRLTEALRQADADLMLSAPTR